MLECLNSTPKISLAELTENEVFLAAIERALKNCVSKWGRLSWGVIPGKRPGELCLVVYGSPDLLEKLVQTGGGFHYPPIDEINVTVRVEK